MSHSISSWFHVPYRCWWMLVFSMFEQWNLHQWTKSLLLLLPGCLFWYHLWNPRYMLHWSKYTKEWLWNYVLSQFSRIESMYIILDRLIFVTLIFEIYHIFISSDKHYLLKRVIPRSLKLVEYWFYGHFSKHSQCQFSLQSRDISVRDNGFSDFHTFLPGNPLIRAN